MAPPAGIHSPPDLMFSHQVSVISDTNFRFGEFPNISRGFRGVGQISKQTQKSFRGMFLPKCHTKGQKGVLARHFPREFDDYYSEAKAEPRLG